VAHQRAADQPVGEGELFLEEARSAVDRLLHMPMDDAQIGTTVRHLRNELMIEAVAVVDPDGVIRASTTPAMEGTALGSGLLASALDGGRFAAQATPLASPITMDGVEEWAAGDVLYQVIHPLDEDHGAVLLMYDVSVLLERRARAAGIQSQTVVALAVAVSLGALAVLMLFGRSMAGRRFREYEIEARFLRTQAAQLEEHNKELDEARQHAERALSLAEEKNRIRSEFVMMINHELRTPLTSLVSGAELLQSGEVPDTAVRTILEDMIDDGRRLEDMIRQILDVARIENRGLWYELQDIPAAALYEQIVLALPRTTIEVLDGALRDGHAVHTDPQTVSSLIGSLTNNAMSHGATAVTATVATEYRGPVMYEVGDRPEHAMFITVADDGPGIRPEFLPRAFEKFEKDSFSSGTGLGLYVARLMIEAIEGSLMVDTDDTGTRMTIAIPLVGDARGSEVAA
jgi:signal transduction histidine kinase